LFHRGNVEIKIIYPDQAITLSERLTLHPVEVPHRASAGKTLAFAILGPGRRLFFCPDIDSWAAWGRDLYPFIASFDIALLDGTFFDIGELPGRNLSSIPHPYIIDTMDLLEGVNCEVLFVHLNHTNPLLRSGEARELADARGFQVGFEGQTWDLASAEPNT
jgi:pyrroloquinoline quinone biosynthesis protein B